MTGAYEARFDDTCDDEIEPLKNSICLSLKCKQACEIHTRWGSRQIDSKYPTPFSQSVSIAATVVIERCHLFAIVCRFRSASPYNLVVIVASYLGGH